MVIFLKRKTSQRKLNIEAVEEYNIEKCYYAKN